MRKTSRYCSDCNDNTPHVQAGLMPRLFTSGEVSSAWDKVAICTECGGLTTEAVRDQEVQNAHQRYLEILVEEEVMTEEEIEKHGIKR